MAREDWPVAAPLESERLALEPLRVEHASEMVAALADPELYEFTGGRPPSERELRERYGRQARGRSPDGSAGWLNWVLRERAGGEPVGTVQATLTEGGEGSLVAELAWIVSSRQQGNGYAREAAAAVVEWLATLGVDRLQAHIRAGHAASASVARRLGMRPTERVENGEVVWVAGDR